MRPRDTLTMSRKEAPRVGLLKALVAGRVTGGEVAAALRVSRWLTWKARAGPSFPEGKHFLAKLDEGLDDDLAVRELRVYEVEAPTHLQAADSDGPEDAACEIGAEREAGDDRDAGSRLHGRLDRLRAAERQRDVELRHPGVVLAEIPLEHPPTAGSVLSQDERLREHLCETDLFDACPAMVRRDDEQQLVLDPGLHHVASQPDGITDDREVESPAAERIDERVGVAGVEDDRD